jgi:hypothetical protein
MLHPAIPAVILAPMEGVTDAPMRAVQGEIGAFTFAVSEFLRVSQTVPPRSVFHRMIPELCSGSRTPNGLPVQVQLLGGDAGRLAKSAAIAVEVGATAIDLNFGCPARNTHYESERLSAQSGQKYRKAFPYRQRCGLDGTPSMRFTKTQRWQPKGALHG